MKKLKNYRNQISFLIVAIIVLFSVIQQIDWSIHQIHSTANNDHKLATQIIDSNNDFRNKILKEKSIKEAVETNNVETTMTKTLDTIIDSETTMTNAKSMTSTITETQSKTKPIPAITNKEDPHSTKSKKVASLAHKPVENITRKDDAKILSTTTNTTTNTTSIKQSVPAPAPAPAPAPTPSNTQKFVKKIKKQNKQATDTIVTNITKIPSNSTNNATKSHFKLIFFIGLEGVGHHLLKQFFQENPDVVTMSQKNLKIMPRLTYKLYDGLFHTKTRGIGLWSSFCSTSGPDMDPRKQYDNLVHLLKQIQERSIMAAGDHTNITMPLNTVDDKFGFGMMSYPSFKTPCRPITYPNLDILYKACKDANVDCRQILISRDPMSVISSTSIKRNFNPTVLKAIHLYLSHLYFIYSQLLQHSEKTISCHDFYEPSMSHEVRWGPLRDLFGWTDQNEFKNHVDKVYNPPKPMTEDERNALVPSEYHVFMSAFSNMHNRVINLCRELQAKNNFSKQNQLVLNETQPVKEDIRQHTDSPVKIVLTIGLKGAGHEVLGPIIQQDKQQQNGFDLVSFASDLFQAVYRKNQPQQGLLSMHCSNAKAKQIESKYQHVVRVMQQLKQNNITTTNKKKSQQQTIIPLNLMFDTQYLSYPNQIPMYGCQQLDYINIDIFYRACNDAGIDCEHVHVYRDPYLLINDIVKQIQQRESDINSGNKGNGKIMPIIYYMHLYLSFLFVLHGQLLTHPHRTAACLDMNNDNNNNNLWNSIKSVYGLNQELDNSNFTQAMKQQLPSKPSRKKRLKALVPEEYDIYMESLMVAYDNVVELCQEQVE